MAKLKPWYQVVTPRQELREDRPLDASEFAVHLDHIRARRAHDDYLKPERFFERTYLTQAQVHAVPRADVAVFVGTEFDVVDGRGGDDKPRRQTPWGEIAWQLGGAPALAVVAQHDARGTAPGGDVIRRMLPAGPVLILMDELLNYVSRARRAGLADQLFNFLQNLSEEARARDNRFGLRPNLNQMLVTRRGAIPEPAIDERVRKTVIELFNQVSKDGPKAIEHRYFPGRSNDVPDRPSLTLVVLGVEHLAGEASTQALIEQLLREYGNAARTFKSGLLFTAPDSATAMVDAARTLLAWEDINDDIDAVGQLEENQKRALAQSLGRARADLREAIWRAYRHVLFLTQDNRLTELDLGHVTSSMAPSITELIVNTLVRDDEITASVGPNRLVRLWPPAMTAWSTKAVRDAFLASPALPRLLEPEAIKRTIADGVSARLLGYARKAADGRLVLERFGESLSEAEVEISDEVCLLRAEDAQKLVEPPRLASLLLHPERAEVGPQQHVTFRASGRDQYGQPYVDTQIRVVATLPDEKEAKPDSGPKTIRWDGTLPPQKWMNFYTRVLSKLVASPGSGLFSP